MSVLAHRMAEALALHREYWRAHREELVREGCRGYVRETCVDPGNCPWHPKDPAADRERLIDVRED